MSVTFPLLEDFSEYTVDTAAPIELGDELWDGYWTGYFISTSACSYVASSDATRISDPISVEEGKVYCFSGGNRCRLMWKDADDDPISCSDEGDTGDARYAIAPPGAVKVEYYFTNASGTSGSVKEVLSGFPNVWSISSISNMIRASGDDKVLRRELSSFSNRRRAMVWTDPGNMANCDFVSSVLISHLPASDGTSDMSVWGLTARMQGGITLETCYILILRRGADSDTGAWELGKYVNGSYSAIGSAVSFELETATEIFMRLSVQGTSLKGKVWTGELGDEPEEWGVSETDTSLSSGAVGVFCFSSESASQTYTVPFLYISDILFPVEISVVENVALEESLLVVPVTEGEVATTAFDDITVAESVEVLIENLDVSVEDTVTCAEDVFVGSPQVFETDFSEYTNGVNLSDWTSRWSSTNFSWQAADSDWSEPLGKMLNLTSGVGNARRGISWDSVGVVRDCNILVSLGQASWTNDTVRVLLRCGGSSGAERGYLIRFSDQETLAVFKYGETSTVTIASVDITAHDQLSSNLRIVAEGSSIKIKYWHTSGIEPVDYVLEVEDDEFAEGWVGLSTFNANHTVKYYYFACGVNGAVPSLPEHSSFNIGWGFISSGAASTVALGVPQLHGGEVHPDFSGRITAIRIWRTATSTSAIRLGVYKGGEEGDPTGAVLLADGGLSESAETGDGWTIVTLSEPVAIEGGDYLWIAVKGSSGFDQFYSAAEGQRGNFCTNGRFRFSGMDSDPAVAFPNDLSGLTGVSSNTAWYFYKIDVEAGEPPVCVEVSDSVVVSEELVFSWSDQEVSIFDTCSVEEWLALEVSEPAAVPAISISSAEEVGVTEWIGVLLSDLAVSVGEDISVSEDVGVLAEEAAGLEVSVYEECSLVELSTIEYSVATHFRYWRLALFGANSVYYTEGSFSTSGFVLADIELRSSKGGTNEVGSGTASAIGTTTSTAENAFDGDPDTTWLANIAQNGWIQYDFGSGNDVQIEEVVLTAGKGTNEEWRCPACFILYYWDGSDWIPKHTWLYEVEGWLSGETKVFNDASSGYAPLSSGGKKRYWRIWATNSTWNQQRCAILRMREEKNGVDRMGSGTPSAVSEHASNPPSNFTDENTVTYWIADTDYYQRGSNCPWYGYDFGEGNSFEIGEWTFTTDESAGSDRGPRNNYIVVCSDDGADWEVAWANQDYTGSSNWSAEQTKTFTNPNCPEITHPDISCFSSVTLLEEVGCAISAPGAGIDLNVEVMESVAVIDGVVFFFAELVISAATEVSLTETLLLDSDYFVAVDTTVSVSEFTTVEGGHVLCSVVDTVSVTEAPWPAVSDLLAVVSEDVVLSEEVGTDRFALSFSLNEGVSVEEDVSLVVFPADALVEVSDACGLSEDVELSLVSLVDVAVSEAVGVAEGVEGVVPFLPLSVQDGTFIQEGVGSESNLLGIAFDSVTVAEDILVVTDSCRVEVSEVVVCAEGDGVVLSSSQIELFEGVGLAEVVVVEVQEVEARLITCWEDVAVTEDVGLGGNELNAFALTDVIVREYAYPYWVIAHGQLLMFAEPEIPEVLIVTSVIDIEIDCLIPEIEVEVA